MLLLLLLLLLLMLLLLLCCVRVVVSSRETNLRRDMQLVTVTDSCSSTKPLEPLRMGRSGMAIAALPPMAQHKVKAERGGTPRGLQAAQVHRQQPHSKLGLLYANSTIPATTVSATLHSPAPGNALRPASPPSPPSPV
jgi:hypothetical protein